MKENMGASSGSRASRQASGLDPSGFDPARRPRVWNARKKNAPLTVVYVGRGTRWGNPFVMGKDGNRDEVCDRFEREVLPTLDVTPLIGQDLLCWCAPLRCHADALLRKASAIETGTAKTAGLGPQDESASDAPKISQRTKP